MKLAFVFGLAFALCLIGRITMTLKVLVSFVFCCLALVAGASRAAELSPSLLKAKQHAESQGFIFINHHDEIVAEAKKEARLRFLLSETPMTINALVQAFKQRYPFINAHGDETSGSDAGQRFMLELEAGHGNWDAGLIHLEWYSRYLSHSKKFDLLGMAQQQVLHLPLTMIDPRSRRFVSATSDVTAITYNRCTLKSLKVPGRWEDFLKPQFKGRKFVADLRPAIYPSIAAGAGEKWMLEYAQRLAAQEPVWIQGNTRAVAAIASGEHALSHGVNYGPAIVAASKDPKGCFHAKIIEPVLARINKPYFIVDRAQSPFSALLWLEFLASTEAQTILDRLGQSSGSILSMGSESQKIVRGKTVWLRDWNVIHQSEKWMKMTVEAFGFPKAGGLR